MLESALNQRSTVHDDEIRKLYEEMEGQIRTERQRVLFEVKLSPSPPSPLIAVWRTGGADAGGEDEGGHGAGDCRAGLPPPGRPRQAHPSQSPLPSNRRPALAILAT